MKNLTWRVLNTQLLKMTEEQCLQFLQTECEEKKRLNWILRIYSRYNRLRGERERHLYMRRAK